MVSIELEQLFVIIRVEKSRHRIQLQYLLDGKTKFEAMIVVFGTIVVGIWATPEI